MRVYKIAMRLHKCWINSCSLQTDGELARMRCPLAPLLLSLLLLLGTPCRAGDNDNDGLADDLDIDDDNDGIVDAGKRNHPVIILHK